MPAKFTYKRTASDSNAGADEALQVSGDACIGEGGHRSGRFFTAEPHILEESVVMQVRTRGSRSSAVKSKDSAMASRRDTATLHAIS